MIDYNGQGCVRNRQHVSEVDLTDIWEDSFEAGRRWMELLNKTNQEASITVHAPPAKDKPKSKWPANSWVSVKHDCTYGHQWRLAEDHSIVPTETISDIVCIACDLEISSSDVVIHLMDSNFMIGKTGIDIPNQEFWDAIADNIS